MLEVKELRAGYGGRDVLQGVSLTAQAGEVTAVIGPNGCGKSTLLKALCGILRPQAGEVLLEGESLLSLPQQAVAQRVVYLAQSHQTPDITAGRLVLHGRFPYLSYPRRYRREDHEIARQAMARMGVAGLEDVPMGRLSGGQQQKVYIASALAQDTGVVLLDEPTTYLDVACQLQVLEQARTLAQDGRHVLMVIHDLSHAMETADRVALMQEGRLVCFGTPEEVYCSGRMDEVFGVTVHRVRVGDGWRYFCTERL